MNKAHLMGWLTRDPEIRYAQNQNSTAVARFSLAVPKKIKREGEPDSDFFNCTCFGKTAEFVEKYIHKGTKIIITGRIENDNYTNKEGQKVYGVKILVEEIEFAESKRPEENNMDKDNRQGNEESIVNIPSGVEEELPFN